MVIVRNGKNFELSKEELYQAFVECERNFLREDALAHFISRFEGDGSNIKTIRAAEKKEFKETYGFAIEEAVDSESSHYIIDDLVDRFIHCRDCDCPENDVWDEAIDSYLDEIVIDDDEDEDEDD